MKPFKNNGRNSFPYNFNKFQELFGIDTSVDEDTDELTKKQGDKYDWRFFTIS